LSSLLFCLLCSSHSPQDRNQDTRADDSYDDAPDKTKVGIGDEQVSEQTANEGPDEPDDNVAYESVATAAHNPARQETGDQTYDEPDDETCGTEGCGENKCGKFHMLLLLLIELASINSIFADVLRE
jgi:uncharacterized protein involved in copper resistance